MYRKIMAVLLAAVTVISLCACSSQAPAATEAGKETVAATEAAKETPAATKDATSDKKGIEEVYVYSASGNAKSWYEEKVANWNNTVGAEKGIRIKFETNIESYSDALNMMFEAGTAPDIAMAPSANMILNGYIRSLDDNPYIKEVWDLYSPYSINGQNVFNGKTYAFITDVYPIKLAINTDIFRECGLIDANGNVTPPKTLDEMVEYAKIITEKGNGEYYGVGYCAPFPLSVSRLMFQPFIASTGKGWFDNAAGKYDFEPFRPVLEAYKQMFDDGSVFPGWETIGIDPIRAQFSEGHIGMYPAPAYDIGVYNDQFPAKCDWMIVDPPQLTETPEYYYDGWAGTAFCITSGVTDERLEAVSEVFNFLQGKEMYAEQFAKGTTIPVSPEIIDYAKANFEMADKKNWDVMGDITNYRVHGLWPDDSLLLDGDSFQVAFEKVVAGELTVDEMISQCNDRYNEAYQIAVEDGTVVDADYHYDINIKK